MTPRPASFSFQTSASHLSSEFLKLLRLLIPPGRPLTLSLCLSHLFWPREQLGTLVPHLGPPSVSPKISQRPTGNCTSLCRSDYEEPWNLRSKGVCLGAGRALTLLQSVSGSPHGTRHPRSPQSCPSGRQLLPHSRSRPASVSSSVSNAPLVCSGSATSATCPCPSVPVHLHVWHNPGALSPPA